MKKINARKEKLYAELIAQAEKEVLAAQAEKERLLSIEKSLLTQEEKEKLYADAMVAYNWFEYQRYEMAWVTINGVRWTQDDIRVGVGLSKEGWSRLVSMMTPEWREYNWQKQNELCRG